MRASPGGIPLRRATPEYSACAQQTLEYFGFVLERHSEPIKVFRPKLPTRRATHWPKP
jgi:hypothetical protein